MEFAGRFRLERDEHFDDYLKEIGECDQLSQPAECQSVDLN